MKTPKKILIPVDLSVYSLAGVEYGQEIAAMFDADVILLTVEDEEMAFGHIVVDEQHEHARHDQIVKTIQNLLVNHDLVKRNLRIEVRAGSPATEIVRAAEELHVDLIVLSTHGRTGLSHVFLGSVAEEVVRRSRCPVLTVKPEEIRELIDIHEEDVLLSLHIQGQEAEPAEA